MKKIILILSLLYCSALMHGKVFVYQVTIGDKILTNEVNPVITPLESTDEILVYNNSGLLEGNSAFICSKDWNVKSCAFTNEFNNTAYTAVRIGNSINLEGKFKGNNIKKELKIDGKPWCQMVTFIFPDFINSGKDSLEYWMIQKWSLEAITMVLKRGKEETIVIGGKEYETVHIEHTPGGLMALLWKAEYWVRKSDGVFVRFKGLLDRPGSPSKLMELIEER